MGPFQIVQVAPPGNPHTRAFEEVVQSLHFGFSALGIDAPVAYNSLSRTATNILFGANLLSGPAMASLPRDVIVYNLEQVDSESFWMQTGYLDLLERNPCWDYSARNIAALKARGRGARVRHVPIGYVPELTRIPRMDEDIDVLFYGSVNARRQAILDALTRAGLKVHAVFGVYGQERDALIARAKVVLNLHFYDSSIFEVVRVSYLLANRKAVVAECHGDTEIEDDLRGAVRPVPYDGLVQACVELVADAEARERLAAAGFARMSGRSLPETLRGTLGLAPAASTGAA